MPWLTAAPGLAGHMWRAGYVVGRATGPGCLDGWVRSKHRPFTDWKPGQMPPHPGSRLLMVKLCSRVAETASKSADLGVRPRSLLAA